MRLITCLLLLLFSQAIQSMEGCTPISGSDSELIHCKVLVGEYPRPVHFFIPTNLDFAQPLKTIVHFHGHNLAGYDHFYRTKVKGEGYGDFGAFLINSKFNGVVVVPESLGNCSTYDTFFTDQRRTLSFFSAVEKKITGLNKPINPTLIVSGHSGAYRVVNKLAGYSALKIKSIGLFDATYGNISNIELWIQNRVENNEDFIFYNSYVSGPKATADTLSLKLRQRFESYHSDKIFFRPVPSLTNSVVLDVHFSVLKIGGLSSFWKLSSP